MLTERGSENMNKQNLLLKKTDREYEEYINGKRNQTPDEIIANAEEIAGIKLMYDAVKEGTFSEEECEYLLTLSKPLQTMYLHHEMDRGTKAAGVKRIPIHSIRHSHISLLIDLGFSAVAIANRVGHESIDITYNYAHMFPSTQLDMANKLNEERGEDNG